jgi:hypothetical protein
MLIGLMLSTAWAMPAFHGTLAADGQFTVRIIPDSAWESAELHVVGGGATELDAAEPEVSVVVEGWTDADGPLRITLIAAQPSGKGVTWLVEVDPFRVPASAPELTDRRSKVKR